MPFAEKLEDFLDINHIQSKTPYSDQPTNPASKPVIHTYYIELRVRHMRSTHSRCIRNNKTSSSRTLICNFKDFPTVWFMMKIREISWLLTHPPPCQPAKERHCFCVEQMYVCTRNTIDFDNSFNALTAPLSVFIAVFQARLQLPLCFLAPHERHQMGFPTHSQIKIHFLQENSSENDMLL